MKLDEIDIEILHILQQNSSKPFVDIADEIGVTDGTIHQRVKKLKKMEIIKKFTVKLDQEALGGSSIAFVLVTVTPGYIEPISKEISELQNVLEVYEVHARGELMIKIRALSQEEVRNIVVDEIRRMEGVSNTELIPVYKAWKEENNLPILKQES